MSCFFIFILFISNVGSQVPVKFSLQTGASVTLPCRYDKRYIQYKKYWCYNSRLIFSSCKIRAQTNETQGNVIVTDNPAENFFTVTMNNLQTGDTGSYWCAVKKIGLLDVKEAFSITVKPDADLSAMESRVRGEEGGSVTVQCLYSAAYQSTQKQWCRFRDGVCNTLRRTETYERSAVTLRDDGRRNFSVQMSELKKSDAGWYWCSAGDLQVPVHVAVSTLTVSPNVTRNTDQDNSVIEMMSFWLPVVAGLVLLFVLLNVVACTFKKLNKKRNSTRAREKSIYTAAFRNSATVTDDVVTYGNVHAPGIRNGVVIYCNVHAPGIRDDVATYSNVHVPGIRDNVATYSAVGHK